MSRPPRLPRWLLARALPPDVRQAALGDLDEEYRRHVRPARGAWRAGWWYWTQALTSLPWAARLARRRAAGRRTRDAGRGAWLAGLSLDVRYGVRLLARQPGFTLAVVVTLALGIGAATAIFSVVDAVLLRPLPYAAPDRLVHLFEQDPRTSERREASYPEYLDWRRLNRTLSEVAGYNGGSVTIAGGDRPDRVRVAAVTANFFRTLGVSPVAGRTFEEGEDRRGGPRVVVLTDAAWQRRFGGDPSVVGRAISLNGHSFTVVGVLPADFQFPLRGAAELYLPLQPSAAQEARRYWHWLDLIGRLRPGVTAAQAQADLGALARASAASVGAWHADVTETVVPLRAEMVHGVRPALVALAAAVGVLLLVTSANVAGLLLARAATRRRELSVRAAVGAGRWRLVRQLLVESLLLTAAGGAAGVLVARWGLDGLLAAIPERQRLALPYLRDLSPDAGMLGFALAITLAVGLLAGLAPAWRVARDRGREDLAAAGRSAVGPGPGRLRPALVAAEMALAVVLAAGAALLGLSFARVLDVSPGFDPAGLLTMNVTLSGSQYSSAAVTRGFHRRLLERVRGLPGVRGAETIDQLPLTGRGNTGIFTVVGGPDPEGGNPECNIRTVSAGYFHTMGVPLLAGRAFTARDTGDAAKVVLVNQRLVERIFPDRDPLGQRIVFSFFDGRPPWTIVGIVGNERFGDLDEPMTPVVYFPYGETPDRQFSVVVRSLLDAGALAESVRRETAALDPSLPVYGVRTMSRIAADSTAVFLRRDVLMLMGAFAGLAILLAAIGLYGVLAQSVAERTREIGVRVALGATRRDVARLVVRRGLVPAGVGLAAGLAAAAGGTRLLGVLLFEVHAGDPLTLAGVAGLLAVVAGVATWVPARRAARVDPVIALRVE